MRSSAAQPDGGDHVLALCHMLSNRIGRAFVRELAEYGFTVAEWRVALTLGMLGNASGKKIASHWAMDKMAVNRAVKSLQRRGLVRKKPNSRDRRTIELSLTPAGQAMYKKFLPVANERYHQLMACLDKNEVAAFRRILTKMIAHADSMRD